jgi:SnoaL-like domain
VSGMRRWEDHADLSQIEVTDRRAIRELVDACAYYADRRDAAGQMELFTEDTELVIFADRRDPEPTQKVRGRAALTAICGQLNAYQALHLNGQSTMRVDGARAWGVTDCLVHLLPFEETARSLMIIAVRYLDSFVKQDGTWFIRHRQVLVDWTETRTLTTVYPVSAARHFKAAITQSTQARPAVPRNPGPEGIESRSSVGGHR